MRLNIEQLKNSMCAMELIKITIKPRTMTGMSKGQKMAMSISSFVKNKTLRLKKQNQPREGINQI